MVAKFLKKNTPYLSPALSTQKIFFCSPTLYLVFKMELLEIKKIAKGLSCITELLNTANYCLNLAGKNTLPVSHLVELFQETILGVPLGLTCLPDLDDLIVSGSLQMPIDTIQIDGVVFQRIFQEEDDFENDYYEEPEFDDNIYEAFQLGEIKSLLAKDESVVLMPLKSSLLVPPIEWVSIISYDSICNTFQQLGRQATIPCAAVDPRYAVVVSGVV
jgi:hypothetical protein